MYLKTYYKEIDELKIQNDLKKEGFKRAKFTNRPGDVYSQHFHKETKILAFLQGAMKVKAGDKTYDCKVGDRLIIEGNITHSAVVGAQGCTFFWAEKL